VHNHLMEETPKVLYMHYMGHGPAAQLATYSVAGFKDTCVVERKDLDDLIHSFTAERSPFIDRLRRMSSYPHRLLVVTSALSEVKSPYPHSGTGPNRSSNRLSLRLLDCSCLSSPRKLTN
jgi:hypothetical protein